MKMISRRDFLKASAVVGAAAAMTACGGSSSSTAASSVASSTAASAAATNGSATVGVCIYQFADNFMTLYRADLEGYLKDMGYSVTIMDGKNDQNTQTEEASHVAIPLRKGDASATLLEAINNAIDELRADGTLKELSEKYFGQDISSEN